ncbi:cytochrome c1 [Sphingomonas montanisoli]|uniref:Cytochrome c1 n=1 Tax=Sphingomonas montanisoli TaxID=2606412 RepID=A0A5D9CBW4_9SPHN|nr:cytochrome c1 [Sphingomonas montanisoli]TZG27555.1 cytochrome c1 [Sphingomonas montanisoli]
MVRLIAFLAGLGFVGILLYSLIMGAVSFVSEPPAKTVEHEFHLHPKELHLASDGPLGKFDRQQLQRGFQVYKEVCAACHSLHQVAFRDFKDLGFSEAEVKAIAKGWATETPSVNPETGEPATRKSTPADKIPSPYANEVAARAANNNALPPDLSLMSKARHDGGAYIYSLLTGYTDQAGFKNHAGQELLKEFPDAKTPDGLHFNPYFANLNIAMPPPLAADGQVTYADGTVATKDQMAKDVSAFLVWSAEPKLEARHQTGVAVMIFLLIATVLAWFSYRNIWAGIKH